MESVEGVLRRSENDLDLDRQYEEILRSHDSDEDCDGNGDGNDRTEAETPVQNLKHSLVTLSQMNASYNDDMNKAQRIADKELAEAEELCSKQSREIDEYRRMIADLDITIESDMNSSLLSSIQEAESTLLLLRQEIAALSTLEGEYLDERNKLVNFGQKVWSDVKQSKTNTEYFMSRHDHQREKLKSDLTCEVNSANALLEETDDNLPDSLRALVEEDQQLIDKCHQLELELEVALETLNIEKERLKTLNEKCQEMKNDSERIKEVNQIESQLKEQLGEKQDMLHSLSKRTQELSLQLEQKQGELQITTSELKDSQQENIQKEEQLRIQLSKKRKICKAVEGSVRDLVVLKNKTRVELNQAHRENDDLKQDLLRMENSNSDLMSSMTNLHKRMLDHVRESSEMEEKVSCLRGQILAAKSNLIDVENSHDSQLMVLENYRKDIEDKENQAFKESICCEELLNRITIETEQNSYCLTKQDTIIKQLQLEKDILQEELEKISESVNNFKENLSNSQDTSEESGNVQLLFKEINNRTIQRTEALNEAYRDAEKFREDLEKIREELNLKIKDQKTIKRLKAIEMQALEQEIETVDSACFSEHEEIRKINQETEESEPDNPKKEEQLNLLMEAVNSLNLRTKELLVLISKQRSCLGTDQDAELVLRQQADAIKQKICVEREETETLKEAYNAIASELEELETSKEEKLDKAKEDLDALKASLAKAQESNENLKERNQKWKTVLNDNKEKLDLKEKDANCTNEELEDLRNEILTLKKKIDECKENAKLNADDRAASVQALKKQMKEAKKISLEEQTKKDTVIASLTRELHEAKSRFEKGGNTKEQRSDQLMSMKPPEPQKKNLERKQSYETPKRKAESSKSSEITLPSTSRDSPGSNSSSSSSIVFTKEDREHMKQDPKYMKKIVAERMKMKMKKRQRLTSSQ